MSQIIRSITEIARCTTQYRTETLAPLGLKACHASYLTEICAAPGISQDKLASRICINKSNVARQAAILEEDGFIIRKPSATDKRIMQLFPTQKTLDLLSQISQVQVDLECYLSEDLTEADKELLENLLSRMHDKASDWMNNH